MRQMYNKFTRMTPAERQRFLHKLQRWKNLSPEQRKQVKARLQERAGERRTRTRSE
jgi:hypothetical protein